MLKIFTPQLTFLIIALCFGPWIVVLTPPFQSPDEINHFYKAIHVADGNCKAERCATQRLGGTINVGSFRYAAFFKDRNLHFTDSLRQQSEAIEWSDERQFTDFANTAFYMPFGYIPQVFGIKIGQYINNRIFVAFYLARIFNFLVWLCLVFQSIRLIPFGKWFLVGLGLLPASMAFHCSCNPDVLVHGCAFFTIAYSLHLYNSDTVFLRKEKITIYLLTAFLTVQKIIFLPFVLLFYFNQKVFYKILIVNLSLLVFVYFCNKNTFITYDNYNPEYRQSQTLNEGVNPISQLEYVLHHPLLFTKIVAESFLRGLPSTVAHAVGVFGWSAHYLPIWEIVLLFIALFLICVNEDIVLDFQQKISFLTIILIFIATFSVVMYMLWCPVAAPVLTNLQGRYFIGIIPIALFLVNTFYQYVIDKMNSNRKIHLPPVLLMPIWVMANFHLLILIVAAWR